MANLKNHLKRLKQKHQNALGHIDYVLETYRKEISKMHYENQLLKERLHKLQQKQV